MTFRQTVDLSDKIKLRLDIHSKITKKQLNEIVEEALDDYLPKYFVKIQE